MWQRMMEQIQNDALTNSATPGAPPVFRRRCGRQQRHELQDLQRFMDFFIFSYIKFFDPALDDSAAENFYMEREWRVVGNVPFELTAVTRLLLPESFGRRLRADVPEYAGQVHFLQ